MSNCIVGQNDAIIITKSVGLSGTCALLEQNYEHIHNRYAVDFLEPVKEYPELYTYEKELEVFHTVDWSAYVKAGYGGIFGALFQLGYDSGLGFRVDLEKIKVEQPVIEISEMFDLNPYLLHSNGAMVIACPYGELMVDDLQKQGISACVVGHMTKEKGRIVYLEEEERFLTPARKDELTKCFDEKYMKEHFPKGLEVFYKDECDS